MQPLLYRLHSATVVQRFLLKLGHHNKHLIMGAELANTEISKGTEQKVRETPHLETVGE